MSDERSKKGICLGAWGLLRNNIPLFIGQGIILGLFFLLFTPVLAYGFRLTLNATGFSYVTLDNLGSFLLNPLNIAGMLLLLLLISLFLLFEVYFLVTCLSLRARRQKIRILRLIAASAYRTITGTVKGNLRLIPALWVSLIAFNLPALFLCVRKIRFLRFIAGEIPGYALWIAVVFLAAGMLLLKVYRKAFVFQYCTVRQTACAEAVKRGRDTRCHRPRQTLMCFLRWNAAIVLFMFLIYILTVAVTMLIVPALFDRGLAMAAFISVNERIEGYFIAAMFLVGTVANFSLGTQLFYHYQLAPEDHYEEMIFTGLPSKKASVRRILVSAIVIVIGANAYLVIDVMRNGSALNAVNLTAVQITSHRGFSEDVPENTVPAIEKAIGEQADCVELDVRTTKDGELVLLHDVSLMRTTGVNKYIWDTDYADIAELDAGSWLSGEYSWVRIPKLREVFEACKGRVYLNLDLKSHSGEEGLEEKVVALIEEYDMQWQCVVTSTSLACLEKIRALDPDIQTGYIAYQFLPGMLKNEAVDFFSMNSGLVTRTVVQRIHQSGKILCVWTVDTKRELQRMSRLGVDNIITDNPAYTREVLYQTGSNKYLVTLFEIIME